MAQHNSPSPSGVAPPPWMHRIAPTAPGRRARMLEHMARARSAPQPQAVISPDAPRKGGTDIVGDAFADVVLFGIIALLFRSFIPLYLGGFLFLADAERIEHALAAIGIRLERGAIGPAIIRNFAFLFGWFLLLASLKDSVPAWLASSIPPAESWSFVAGIALALAIVEAVVMRALRRRR